VLALRRREGLSFSELSAASGIRGATLRMWERRERVSRRRSKFVDVEVPVPSPGRSLELVIGERVVRLPAGFDAGELRRLLAVLERPC